MLYSLVKNTSRFPSAFLPLQWGCFRYWMKSKNVNTLPSDFGGFQNSCSWLRHQWYWYDIIIKSNANVEHHLFSICWPGTSLYICHTKWIPEYVGSYMNLVIYYLEITFFGTSHLHHFHWWAGLRYMVVRFLLVKESGAEVVFSSSCREWWGKK